MISLWCDLSPRALTAAPSLAYLKKKKCHLSPALPVQNQCLSVDTAPLRPDNARAPVFTKCFCKI